MSAAPTSNAPDNQIMARWRRIDGACFLFCVGPKPDSDGTHTHKNVRVSFVLKGAILEIDDRDVGRERGAMTMQATPVDAPHSHVFLSDRLSTICFDIEPATMAELGDAAKVFDRPQTVGGGTVSALIPRFQREILRTDSASDLILKGLIYELAGGLLRRPPTRQSGDPPVWLDRARELLQDAWKHDIGVEQIAKTVGVHPSHLVRVFRAHYGLLPGEFLREVRLDHATREVLKTKRPLKEIAADAGFADPSHFSRAFKQRHGVSPDQFRRMAR